MLNRYIGILVLLAVTALLGGCGGDRAGSSKRTAKIVGAATTASLKGIDFTIRIPAKVTLETLPPFSTSPFRLYSTANDPQSRVNPDKYNIALSSGGVLKSVEFNPRATSTDPGELHIVVEFPAGFGPGQALGFNCIAPDSAVFSKADFPILSSTLTNIDGSRNTTLIIEVSDF